MSTIAAYPANTMPYVATIGEKIKYLRTTRRPLLSQKELADAIGGMSRDQIANYETDRTEPPADIVRRLARFWQVPESWLWDDASSKTPPANTMINTRKNIGNQINLVPYWGEVPAGAWERPNNDAELIQISENVDAEGCIAVRVAGRSLWPRLVDGQVVTIKLSKSPKEGVLTLAHDGEGNLTLKVLRYVNGEWQLHSINPDYGNVSAENWEILGHAVHIEESNPSGIRP